MGAYWTALTAVVLVVAVLAPREAQAFLYRAPEGSLKDNCVLWHDGTYHLFTMYRKEQQIADIGHQWRHMWAATSTDGVHWQDVGPVIEDAPFILFAMRTWRAGDRFVLNHGSFTDNRQDVLRFWESEDLVHWRYLGPEYDVRRPDGGRIDHMDVIPVEQDGGRAYYGYAVGGLLRSDDAVRWTWVGELPLTDQLDVRIVQEPGGCERIGDRYYLLVGGFYPGNFNYAVATYVSERPEGPFRPDYPAVRLTGNSGRNVVALWAGYCRTPDELLIINYILDPGGCFWWHAPFKTAVVDAAGHLRMGYWPGNEALKGAEQAVDAARTQAVSAGAGGALRVDGGRIELESPPAPSPRWITPGPPNRSLAVLDTAFDVGKGLVLEGTIQVVPGANALAFPAAGLYLEEQGGTGKGILFQTWGQTEIGTVTAGAEVGFTPEDRVAYGCAAPAGIPQSKPCRFRLLFRREIFEIYLDDLLVQTYATEGATGRIGFLSQDGTGAFSDLRAWDMTLGDR
ncbi:MAG: hypothetical protein JXR94_15190 [Candidatus Hydrogenedentes bacterium]|nr:hypothetical protein [Candidatus Hydrogenedentota bacterium]